jgi:hypothetical protein
LKISTLSFPHLIPELEGPPRGNRLFGPTHERTEEKGGARITFRPDSPETKLGGYSNYRWTAGDGFLPGCTRSAGALSVRNAGGLGDHHWQGTRGDPDQEIQRHALARREVSPRRAPAPSESPLDFGTLLKHHSCHSARNGRRELACFSPVTRPKHASCVCRQGRPSRSGKGIHPT